jgi:hypothetical protein
MKRVLEILIYAGEVLTAITKGAKVASDSWPTVNPFAKTPSNESQGDTTKS